MPKRLPGLLIVLGASLPLSGCWLVAAYEDAQREAVESELSAWVGRSSAARS